MDGDPQSFSLKASPRIELKLIHLSDAGELFALMDRNRDHLRQWHPWVDNLHSSADAENRIGSWLQQHANNQGFCAGIWFDGHLCGAVHHLNVDRSNHSTALSYWLDAAHQGQGIMTASCRALIFHAFDVWGLNRVTIECAARNERSRAIPERLGFKFEGIVRGAEWLHDHYADHAIYGLLRSDFHPAISPAPKATDTPKPEKPVEQSFRLNEAFEQSLKLAFEMHNAGRVREAEALCRVLMQVRPQSAQLLFLLGMILHKADRDLEAVKWFSLAAQYQPRSARIFSGLGCACQGLKDHPRAVAAFEKAMELEAPSAATCYNLGNSCYHLEQIERAAALFRQAVEINPRDSASWNNLGKSLKELNRLDESVQAYDRALEIAPDYALAHYGRAMSLLAAGQYAKGFREYELRQNPMKPRKFSQPEWKGECAPEKTLLVHAEQGFGDAIQMVRFIPAARERVGRVILECRPELAALFQNSNCADIVLPYGAPMPSFDCFVSLLSLPHFLGATLETIPAKTPYLRATPNSQLTPAEANQLKVGLAWAGNPNHHQDTARSIPLEKLAPVLGIPGPAFYSLQPIVPARDEAYLRSLTNIHSDLKFGNFLDTATAIAGLDLVITVDTAVAHLAGALGKPVWMLLQHAPDWRWLSSARIRRGIQRCGYFGKQNAAVGTSQ